MLKSVSIFLTVMSPECISTFLRFHKTSVESVWGIHTWHIVITRGWYPETTADDSEHKNISFSHFIFWCAYLECIAGFWDICCSCKWASITWLLQILSLTTHWLISTGSMPSCCDQVIEQLTYYLVLCGQKVVCPKLLTIEFWKYMTLFPLLICKMVNTHCVYDSVGMTIDIKTGHTWKQYCLLVFQRGMLILKNEGSGSMHSTEGWTERGRWDEVWVGLWSLFIFLCLY